MGGWVGRVWQSCMAMLTPQLLPLLLLLSPSSDLLCRITTPVIDSAFPAYIGGLPTCAQLDPTNASSPYAPSTAVFTPSGTYQCDSGGVMRSATLWLGITGGMVMTVLMAKNVRGSIICGILFTTFISWCAHMLSNTSPSCVAWTRHLAAALLRSRAATATAAALGRGPAAPRQPPPSHLQAQSRR